MATLHPIAMMVMLCIFVFIVSVTAKQFVQVPVPVGHETFGGPKQTGLLPNALLPKIISYARATESPNLQDSVHRTTSLFNISLGGAFASPLSAKGQLLRREAVRADKHQWPDWVNGFLAKIRSFDQVDPGVHPHGDLATPRPASSATSGRIFRMEKIREYKGQWPDWGNASPPALNASSLSEWKCNSEKWAVVTTIFEPSKAIKYMEAFPGWCTVVVGDKSGPQTGEFLPGSSTVFYLSAAIQEQMFAATSMFRKLPWNSFGRKNLGYLFAMSQGARVIFDFDDDNVPLQNMPQPLFSAGRGEVKVRALRHCPFANVYPFFASQGHPWPRGLPLKGVQQAVSPSCQLNETRVQEASVGVEQLLAQTNPDVDAIYRLTQKLPLEFRQWEAPVLLEPGTFAPFNAQATLFHKPAFLTMLLPTTVNGRVSDILRSYLAQPVLWAGGLKVVFSNPQVEVTDRNPHNLMADLDAEWPLYYKSEQILESLRNMSRNMSSGRLLPDQLFALYIHLFEHGIVEEADVQLAKAWVESVSMYAGGVHKLHQTLVSSSTSSASPSSEHARKTNNTWEPPPGVWRFDLAERDDSGSGTNRLGNYLNDWFLSGTCESLPAAACEGEGHGCPGERFEKRLKILGLFPADGTFGSFLLSHRPAFADEVTRYCNGLWWWAYSYDAWRELGALFQSELRPKALEFADQTPSCSDCHPDRTDADSLVVHYRLGDKSSGAITVQALMRGVQAMYDEFHIDPPHKITVLAGSYHMWLQDDDDYKAECERQHGALVKELQGRFPQAEIHDTYGNADEDWLRMAVAPVLVTSHGSYAASAAAVNVGYRATAGCPNLNLPNVQLGMGVPKDIGNNWITYPLTAGDTIP